MGRKLSASFINPLLSDPHELDRPDLRSLRSRAEGMRIVGHLATAGYFGIVTVEVILMN
ncbi:hypothetical protein [Bradyrhizobium sp. CCBAU 51753]|uniref:hypothetical protein n=1 Tax=Bradyrhizobium sp. CCBAU 51753 TaxID=1325100 RepID=UPI00188D6848|nr:hypothetical protein [Bradyrhizobium sp. CCBAU 51753]